MRATNPRGRLRMDSHSHARARLFRQHMPDALYSARCLHGAASDDHDHTTHTIGGGYGLGVPTAAAHAPGAHRSALARRWWHLRGEKESQSRRERAQRQSGDENEAKRSRVRGLMAAAHLRRRPGRHPAGCGGGGARPPTHWPLSAAPTAWERPRTVATAEPHTGTCDRYMICSHAGRPRQARAFRRPSRASSRPSRRAPTPARRRTAARGGPRVHRKTGSTFGDPVQPSAEPR